MILEDIKKEFTKESIKARLSVDTIGEKWRKIKDFSGVVWGISGTALAIMGLFAGVPAIATTVVSGIVTVSGIVYGRARLNKSKK